MMLEANMKTIFNIVLFLFFFSELINSQVTLEWARRYNGPVNSYDYAFAIAVDDSGYVYVTGISQGNSPYADITTIKYRTNGDSLWVRRWNSTPPTGQLSYDIIIDDSSNFYVSGTHTLKYDKFGNLIWATNNMCGATGGFVRDNLGNIYIGGTAVGALTDYSVVKLDGNGNFLWQKIYNGPASDQDQISDIATDLQNNIIVTGRSRGIGTDFDYATIKYDSAGNQLWIRRYNGLASNIPTELARALTVDDSGNVYVTGWSEGVDEDWDCVTIKYKPNGDTAWIQRFIGSTATGDDIILDKMKNIYIAGQIQGNYILLKYDNNGNFIWQRTKPKTAFSPAPSLTLDSLGYIYLACAKPITSSREDLLIVKYDSSGTQLWEGIYNSGFPNDINFPYEVTLDKNFNVYAAGYSVGSGTLHDYVTVKFSQQTGIAKISSEIPEDYELFQNYPNPFNPVTRIKFDIKPKVQSDHHQGRMFQKAKILLVIYDVLGREIQTIVNQNLLPGTYEATFDASTFPSGVYFYTLHANDFKKTRKMVLIK